MTHAGKVFAITSLGDPPEVSLKCDPDLAQALRDAAPGRAARVRPEQAAL